LKIIYASGHEVMIDDEDYENLIEFVWYFHKSDGYVYKNIEKKRASKRISMHKFLMNPAEGMDIDHVDRNKLNNQKSNLRIVEHKINARNRKIPCNNKTGFMGVWKQDNKYVAEIRKDNIKYYLGIYCTALEAALAYDKKAKEFNFDHVNFKE
jgi:hypothetical protein